MLVFGGYLLYEKEIYKEKEEGKQVLKGHRRFRMNKENTGTDSMI